jgi:DNA-directed RNA polymerase subunit N (RpoN/RPB10)
MGFGRKKAYLKKLVSVIFILVILVSGGVFGYMSYQNIIQDMEEDYEKEIETLKIEKYMKKRMVLMPKKTIQKGAVLTEDLVELKEIHSNLSQEIFASKEDFGKQIIINYEEDMPVFSNTLMDNEVTDDQRIREISSVLLQSDLKENEVVDCRIRYANGLEFRVLSKKQIKKIDLANNTIWLSLSEKESLLLSSALVDKAYFQGSSFYVSRYIESNIQEEALVNYIPNQEVITLIEEELGLESYYSTLDQEKRSLLENILYSLDEEQTSQVQADITDEVSSVNKRVADQKITSIDTTEESDAVAEEATYDFD